MKKNIGRRENRRVLRDS